MSAYYKEKGISALAEKAKKFKEFFSGLDGIPDWAKGIASSDFASLIEMKEKIGDKSMVLIFDDLERCRLDSVDVLGAINEYCENMKIHTIIVANQDKMQTKKQEKKVNALIKMDKGHNVQSKTMNTQDVKVDIALAVQDEHGEISYLEIKEKIIQRTVKHIPNFEEIIHTVIGNMKYETQEYKQFVSHCEAGLLELFAPDRANNDNEGKRSIVSA